MFRVFIDGQAGTTGLEISERLAAHGAIEVLTIDASKRKEPAARRDCLAGADVAVLCLPDAAAREAVALAEGLDVRILDASTAHRCGPGWTYGLAELDAAQRDAIRHAARVGNPGCYATAFVLLVRPLVDAGVLEADARLTVHALSGYSGGGGALIERYRAGEAVSGGDTLTRPYALGLEHKHLPEMQRYAGLAHTPLFAPSVGHFRQGMLVHVPLFAATLADGVAGAHDVLKARYADEPCVRVHPVGAAEELSAGFLSPVAANGTNRVDLMLFASPDGERVLLTARLDNLGKGAAGAAVQNLNLMLGIDEFNGLKL